MSEQNVAIVQRTWRRFAQTGEPDLDVLHPEAEIRDYDIPDAAEYRGPDGFRRWADNWGRAWDGYVMRPDNFIDAGDRVVVLVSLTATDGGVTLHRRDAMLYELRDGLIVRLEYFDDRREALAAAGMDPKG